MLTFKRPICSLSTVSEVKVTRKEGFVTGRSNGKRSVDCAERKRKTNTEGTCSAITKVRPSFDIVKILNNFPKNFKMFCPDAPI